MTAIIAATSSLTASVIPTTSVPVVVPSTTVADAVASPAAVVSLGDGSVSTVVDTPLYSSRGVLADAPAALVWENTTQNKVTSTLAGNLYSQATADRFKGLGAALLAQVSTSGSSFSQSVIRPMSSSAASAAGVSAIQTNLKTHADNSINLTIKTASGATVSLSLSSNSDGIAAQVEVTGGKLTDNELAALGKLAAGFQSAIDGLTAKPPKVNLDALTSVDSSLLTSVSLSAQLKGSDVQSLSFQSDADHRSLDVSSLTGDVHLNVDTRNTAILGTAAQQAKALQAYLAKFDAAQSRGQGDETLMGMFKDGFSALNSHLPASSATTGPVLSKTDQAMLTGLADFSASVTQTVTSSNPMRTNEVDSFDYSVSQSTQVQGTQTERNISQQQQAQLDASYHKSLAPGVSLVMGMDPSSQTYAYYQVHDSQSSTAAIAYHKGAIVAATLAHASSQSTTVLTYVLGQLESSSTTPRSSSDSSSVKGLLEAALKQDKATGFGVEGPAYQRALDSIQAQVMAGLDASSA